MPQLTDELGDGVGVLLSDVLLLDDAEVLFDDAEELLDDAEELLDDVEEVLDGEVLLDGHPRRPPSNPQPPSGASRVPVCVW